MLKRFSIGLILLLALVLRVWQLDKVPVSLFGDELDVGYHAYSLLKTGKDYSGNFLPLHLESLADYKTPLFAYSIIPTVGVFGITPLGVRLPAAIFGVLGIYFLYLIINLLFKNRSLALLSAFLLSITPWHIHYSRWGFEGTEMLLLFSAGLYFFLRAFGDGRWLIPSAIMLGLAPISYHSAKIFMPLILVGLCIIYFKQIKQIPKKYLTISTTVFFIIVAPFIFSTLFGGGADRFQATSIFQKPTFEGELGSQRLQDTKVKDKEGSGIVNFSDKFFHNKLTYFGGILITNYLQAFSTEFLFIKGDPEPTHTPSNTGQFYAFQAVFMILGLVFLFLKVDDRKTKLLILLWILFAPLPSIATDHGGFHASRLLFLLPPLTLLASLGIYYFPKERFRKTFFVCLFVVISLSFLLFAHNYWVHYPWESERWWHAGFKEAIQSAVLEGNKYDKVIISGANEPPLIFFLGWSQFNPKEFQRNPLDKQNLEKIGDVERLDKYYFTPIGKEIGLYELGKVLPEKSLYLAPIKEIKLDLIREPGRVPADLTLIKSISYPSGEPAFYLFTKK